MGLELGMALKFYISLEKELKLKIPKFLCLTPTFVKGTWEKLVRETFYPQPHSPPPKSSKALTYLVVKSHCKETEASTKLYRDSNLNFLLNLIFFNQVPKDSRVSQSFIKDVINCVKFSPNSLGF